MEAGQLSMGHARKWEAIHLPLPHLSCLSGLYPLHEGAGLEAWIASSPGKDPVCYTGTDHAMPISAMQKLDATLPWPLYSQSQSTMDTQHSLAGVNGKKLPGIIPKQADSFGVPSLGSVTIAPPGNPMGRDNF